MGLSFGFKALDVRESIWQGDDALANVPSAALEAWWEDGDATHLAPYAKNGEPSKITFRNLTPDEMRIATGIGEGGGSSEAFARHTLMCFRIGVDFPDAPEKFPPDPNGVVHSKIVKERGIRMLSLGFVDFLERRYPGIVMFYGVLISKATLPTDAEKKASSPPSTPRPSSAEASTAATTVPPPSAEGATGAL